MDEEHAQPTASLGEAAGGSVQPPPAPARKGAWTDRRPHQWRRYFARMLDNLTIGVVVWSTIAAVAYSVEPEAAQRFFGLFQKPIYGQVLDAMATLAVMIPVNAAMIGLTGLSPGKWVFGIRVLRDGKPIGPLAGFTREIRVWLMGIAAGVPLISLFTLITAFTHLGEYKATVWDEQQGNTVVHRNVNVLQVLLFIVGAVVILGVAVALRLPQLRAMAK